MKVTLLPFQNMTSAEVRDIPMPDWIMSEGIEQSFEIKDQEGNTIDNRVMFWDGKRVLKFNYTHINQFRRYFKRNLFETYRNLDSLKLLYAISRISFDHETEEVSFGSPEIHHKQTLITRLHINDIAITPFLVDDFEYDGFNIEFIFTQDGYKFMSKIISELNINPMLAVSMDSFGLNISGPLVCVMGFDSFRSYYFRDISEIASIKKKFNAIEHEVIKLQSEHKNFIKGAKNPNTRKLIDLFTSDVYPLNIKYLKTINNADLPVWTQINFIELQKESPLAYQGPELMPVCLDI